MKVVFWGTYDTGKPRVRILLRGLRENGVEVMECHKDIWGGIEDKSQVIHLKDRFLLLLKWLFSYPGLIYRYLRLPKHDVVIVGYLGQLDVLVLWPFARMRKVPVIWDAFLSLYNTVVEDRRLVQKRNPLARLLYWWEKLDCLAVEGIILDTKTHGKYFIDTFGVSGEKVKSVFVGVEPERFPPDKEDGNNKREITNQKERIRVLFYGQFIPLHGVQIIVNAAEMAENFDIEWIIIGHGQVEKAIRERLSNRSLRNLKWIPWVPYEELIDYIHGSDVCLGIFGSTDKAARVIPNKVFQIISAGLPLITQDSPAIRELLEQGANGILLVPPGDPQALLDAVIRITENKGQKDYPLHRELARKIEPGAIGRQFMTILKNTYQAAP